jgi:hypothetical protein
MWWRREKKSSSMPRRGNFEDILQNSIATNFIVLYLSGRKWYLEESLALCRVSAAEVDYHFKISQES